MDTEAFNHFKWAYSSGPKTARFVFSGKPERTKQKKRTHGYPVDKVNRRWESNALQVATQGTTRTWKMNQLFTSPHYTTRWQEIPMVGLIE